MKSQNNSNFENEQINHVKEIVLKHIDKDTTDVFLFGSRINGTNTKYSDIDVGILSDKKIDRRIIRKILEEIEDSRIPYHVDIIDFFTVDKHFKEIALSKTEIWNQKKF